MKIDAVIVDSGRYYPSMISRHADGGHEGYVAVIEVRTHIQRVRQATASSTNGGHMIVKRRIDVEELEMAASDMCKHYCRYPLLWDEQLMNQELSESELCRNCPLSEILTNIVIGDEHE